MSKPVLSIREVLPEDIENIVTYWSNALNDDLDRFGESKRPDENENRKFLQWFYNSNPSLETAGEDILIWEMDARAIGYSTLKQFKIPDYGQLHLHMWEKEMRGKGYGAILFCLSALYFRSKYQLKIYTANPNQITLFPIIC